jgi:hypothetical protein
MKKKTKKPIKRRKKMNSLSNLAKQQDDMRSQVKALAQSSVKPALKEAFADLQKIIPSLTGVQWEQFTPHFNDGDTCEFSVYEAKFQFNDGKDPVTGEEVAADYDNGYNDVGDYPSAYDKVTGLTPEGLSKTQCLALEGFNKNLTALEDLLKAAFDDHAQVTLTAKSIEVEEYEHD